MNDSHPFDLVIGLDRSDRKADLHLIQTGTGHGRSQTIDTSPEALWEWLLQLCQEHPQARVALCLEQPAVHLVAFLEAYPWITLYPINPITLLNFRRAFVTSRAKDDAKDAAYLAELLLTHHAKLKAWAPEDSQTRALQQLVFHRQLLPAALKHFGRQAPLSLELVRQIAIDDRCTEEQWNPQQNIGVQFKTYPTRNRHDQQRKNSHRQTTADDLKKIFADGGN